ncbi:hypothetical protein SeMB42_g01793 [Synchytrium endobioticum]|uniref:Cullin family profile domain-containing protein n=1 Tax=Synchytrium endobioticum TaxID=286115 RepID=A0A507DL16_9FUNG|nr:hypothetical protein SeMB42_g01793 [Synchytrium endobioticum]
MLINKERTVTQLGDSITNPTRPNINWMDVLNAWTIAHETLKNGSIASNGSSALLASALEVLEPLHLEQHLLDSFYEDVCHACRDVFANYSHVNIDSMGFQNLVNELSELLQKHLDSLKSFWPNPTRPTQILVTRFRAQVSASIPIHFHAAIREYLMSSIQTAGRRSLLDNEGRSGNLTERVRHKPEDTASIAQTDKRASPIPSTLFVTDTFAPSLSSRTLVSMSLDDVELDEWRVFVVKSSIDTDDVEHGGRDDAVRSIINILLEDAGKRMETDMPQDAHSNEEIARLIDIFENKEVFAREFQTMLMEKLLANTDYNFTNEAQQLEYLKVKFGESALSMCDVMMKDAMESKRLDALIHKEGETLKELHAMIISRLFWPKLPTDNMVYPSKIQKHINDYRNAFAIARTAKDLHPVPALGTATLELDVEGATREFTVPVPLAAVIIMFEERDQWYVDALATQMEVTPAFLRIKLQAWVSYGVLEEAEHDLYRLVRASGTDGRTSPHQMTYAEDEDMGTSGDGDEDGLHASSAAMVSTMIKHILTNHGSCDIHKLQFHINMVLPILKLTVEALRVVLDGMAEEQDCT